MSEELCANLSQKVQEAAKAPKKEAVEKAAKVKGGKAI